MRLGLFGGTFDPVHAGHLDVARAARTATALDEVWLVPARMPPHRTAPVASAAHRFAMVSLAVQNEHGLLASDLEMDATGPSYTSETLSRLENRGVPLSSVFFVIGADAFRDVPAWKDFPAVLNRCHFVVVSRPGLAASALRGALPNLAPRMVNLPQGTSTNKERQREVPSEPSILLVEAPTSPASSTEIRRAWGDKTVQDGWLPPSVAAHIARHGLYGRKGREISIKGDA
jgi:nicotinate-nucleotide adenylyltransferase